MPISKRRFRGRTYRRVLPRPGFVCVIVAALSIAVTTIAGVELWYRMNGGRPQILADWSQTEFNWKLRTHSGKPAVFAVGDSRMGWGFSPTHFAKAFESLCGSEIDVVNTSLAGIDLGSLLRVHLDYPIAPGSTVIVNFSFAAAYWQQRNAADVLLPKDVRFPEYLDSLISEEIKERLYTYGQEHDRLLQDLLRRRNWASDWFWHDRQVFLRDGFLRTVGRGAMRPGAGPFASFEQGPALDRAKREAIQLNNYRKRAGEIAEKVNESTARRAEILELFAQARAAGIQVVLVKLPVGEEMYKIEETLPEILSEATLATAAEVKSFFYQHDPRMIGAVRNSWDQSHMTPGMTRLVSGLLAEDLISRFGCQALNGPTVDDRL